MKMDSKSTKTISVHRQPQRFFISPPGQLQECAGSRTQAASKAATTGARVKKRDLSPLFSKILKVLEERGNQSPGGLEESSEEMTESEYTQMEEKDHSDHQNPGECEGGSEKKPTEPGSECMDMDEDEEVSYSPESGEENILKDLGKDSTIWSEKSPVSKLASTKARLPEIPATMPTQPSGGDDIMYYEAVYAKASTRKHKKMKSDGYIFITKGSKGTNVVLKDPDGATIESSTYKLDSEHLEDGKIFRLGARDIQICDKLPSKPYF